MILKHVDQTNLLKDLARRYGWTVMKHTANEMVFWTYFLDTEGREIGRPPFKNRRNRIVMTINKMTGTVVTAMRHPVSGRTLNIRRRLMLDELELVFANPRQHTQKGNISKQQDKFNERSK